MSDEMKKEHHLFTTYLVRLLLLGVPVVNVIAAVLWGFAGRDDDTRSFGRAALMTLVTFAVLTLLSGLLAFTFLSTRLFELIP